MLETGRYGAVLRAWFRETLPAAGNARRLGVLTLIQSLGLGVFLTSSAVFFTRTIGIPAQRVGLALSVAGLCGLLCTVPIGRLADRLGAGRVLTVNFLLAAACFTAYCLVDGFAAFLAVACAIAVLETSAGALQASLTDALVGEAERVRVSAQMRSLFNLGFLGGAALAGAAIAAGTSTALYATVLANAALQLVSVAVLLGMRLPPGAGPRATAAAPAAEAPGGVLRSAALRDVRYVAVALVCGALELYHPLLTVGLPLWIVTGTDAPALLVSGLLILDTVLVLLFQVTVSKGARTPAGAARMLRWAGWALGASCLVFAVSGGHGALLDSTALLGGALVLVLGELGPVLRARPGGPPGRVPGGVLPGARAPAVRRSVADDRPGRRLGGDRLAGPRRALRPARARRAAVGPRPGEGPRADGAGAGLSGPAGTRPDPMCHTRPTDTSRRAP